MSKPVAYSLTKTDLSSVGGPMHMQSTPTLWTRYFKTVPQARFAAESDHGKKIKWLCNTISDFLQYEGCKVCDYRIFPIVPESLKIKPLKRKPKILKPRKKPAAK